MRKLFTLFLLGVFSLSMLATVLPGTSVDIESLKLSPEGLQLARTLQARAEIGLDVSSGQKRVMKRTYEDFNFIWELSMIVNTTNWHEVLVTTDKETGQQRSLDFVEFPYYWVNYYLTATRKTDNQVTTSLYIPLCWPTRYMWEQTKEEYTTGVKIPDDEKILDIVTNIEMFEATAFDQLAKTFRYSGDTYAYYGDDSKSWLGAFAIAPNVWAATENSKGWSQTFNRASTYLLDGEASRMSEIFFDSWNADESTYVTKNDFYFDNGASLHLTFEGGARMKGFSKDAIEIPFITTPHIIYTGVEEASALGAHNMYSSNVWGPFSKFFVVAGIGNCEAVVRNGQNIFQQDWSKVMGVTKPNNNDPFSYVCGYLFKEPDTDPEDPYGWWTMSEPVINYDENSGEILGSDMEPRLNQLIPTGYDTGYFPWSDGNNGDCFSFVEDGYYNYLQKDSKLILGDSERGMVLTGTDNYGNSYIGQYYGEIILHPNPSNLSEMVTIPSYKEIEVNVDEVESVVDAKIVTRNGFICVMAAADINVSVYTLSGQLVKSASLTEGMSIEMKSESGIYIVKAGSISRKIKI